MRSGIRFEPPEVELSPALCWALQCAFAHPTLRVGRGRVLDPAAALGCARQFSLTERIGSRCLPGVLEDELGGSFAGRFREATTRSATLSVVVELVCQEIAELAAEFGVPVVFLKGAALLLAGKTAPGSRDLCDVDVLAPEEGARRLQGALVGAGCRALQVRESDHQLQPLTHNLGLGIEVHKVIPGVRLGGGSSATAIEIIESGLARAAPRLKEGSYIPNDDVVCAHLIVHGVAQHGMSPEGYPMARMLADLQDLGIDSTRLAEFFERGYALIAADVSHEEVEAVAGLARRLGDGEDPTVVATAADGPGILLRHLVAGTVDESYRQSMKFRSLAAAPRDGGRTLAMVNTLRGALLLTKSQVDILYGPPRTLFGYWGWRLWRPFDLVLRTFRYGWAWLSQRWNRRA